MLTYCAQKLRDISIAVILEVLKDFLTATLFVDVVGVRLVEGVVVKHNSLSVIISTWRRFSARSARLISVSSSQLLGSYRCK